jgi:hypothetical protein
MATTSASVHKSPDGKFHVLGKDNEVLHTFPTEGEANLQLISIEQAEKAEKEAKAKDTKAEAKDTKHDTKHEDNERTTRHR